MDPDFRRHTFQNRPVSRELYNPADEEIREAKRKSPVTTVPSYSPRPQQQQQQQQQQQPTSRQRGVIEIPADSRYPNLILQPDSRPISQEQLAAEVKSIYHGLTMIESKCIHLDKSQSQADAQEKIPVPADHWRVMIGLHRTLLHEHHDFFLASQHPSASPALQRLAGKYNMPARMWKHGIHSFLELLRHHLPASLEFMVSFIYMAYQMMSLLYETVPTVQETWIECLGDLSRYRMAVEEEDPRDREVWAGVARFWYSKAADRMPNTGRLYHHLAILARPNNIQQLYLYSRALTSTQAFLSARESIQILFDPVLKDTSSDIDVSFIKAHALLFHHRFDEVQEPMTRFHDLLNTQIGVSHIKWREPGVHLAVSNIAALFGYGAYQHLRYIFETGNMLSKPPISAEIKHPKEPPPPDAESEKAFRFACEFTFKTLKIILARQGDINVFPFVSVTLSFVLTLTKFQHFKDELTSSSLYVVRALLSAVPWQDLCHFLNTLARSEQNFRTHYETTEFIRSESGDHTVLPEDHLVRGEVFTHTFFPNTWFNNANSDDEEKSIEHASTAKMRADRILWVGFMLASVRLSIPAIFIDDPLITFQQNCISYSSATKTWTPKMPDFLLQPAKPLVISTHHAVPSIEVPIVDTAMSDAPAFDDAAVTLNPQSMEDLQSPRSLSEESEEDSPEMKQLDVPNKHAVEPSSPSLTVPNKAFNVIKHVASEMLQAGKTVRLLASLNLPMTNSFRSWYAMCNFFYKILMSSSSLSARNGT